LHARARDHERDLYVLRGEITSRLLPTDRLPSWQTVYQWFACQRDEAIFERMNQA
jgi:hypothetical protein